MGIGEICTQRNSLEILVLIQQHCMPISSKLIQIFIQTIIENKDNKAIRKILFQIESIRTLCVCTKGDKRNMSQTKDKFKGKESNLILKS